MNIRLLVICSSLIAAGHGAACQDAETPIAPPTPGAEYLFGFGADYLADRRIAGLQSSASGSTETVAGLMASRLAAGADATLWADGGLSGTGFASAEVSASLGSFLLLAQARGGLEGEGGESDWNGGLLTRLEFQGLDLSISASPRFSYDSAPEGGGELGFGADLSFLAGSTVLKPGFEAAVLEANDGTRSLSLRPGVGLSWYPSIPFALSTIFAYTRSWYPAGGTGEELGLGLSAFGALGERLLFKAAARVRLAAPDYSLTADMVQAELSFLLSESRAGELRAPLRLSWDSDSGEGVRLYVGFQFSSP